MTQPTKEYECRKCGTILKQKKILLPDESYIYSARLKPEPFWATAYYCPKCEGST